MAGTEERSEEKGTQAEMRLEKRNCDCEVPYRRGELIKEDQVELLVREKKWGPCTVPQHIWSKCSLEQSLCSATEAGDTPHVYLPGPVAATAVSTLGRGQRLLDPVTKWT